MEVAGENKGAKRWSSGQYAIIETGKGPGPWQKHVVRALAITLWSGPQFQTSPKRHHFLKHRHASLHSKVSPLDLVEKCHLLVSDIPSQGLSLKQSPPIGKYVSVTTYLFPNKLLSKKFPCFKHVGNVIQGT